jgi:hypothetical protein
MWGPNLRLFSVDSRYMLFSNRHTFKSIWFELRPLRDIFLAMPGTPDPGHERFAQAIADGRMSNAGAFRIAFDKPNLRTAVQVLQPADC